MRSWRNLVVTLWIAGWFANPATAQFSLALDGSRAVAASQMAQREDVQKEIGCSPEQIRKLKEMDDATRDQRLKEFEALAQIDVKARDKARTDLVLKITEEQNKSLAAILTPQQIQRLKQCTWQVAGSQALKNKEVEDALALGVEQKQNIQRIMKAAIGDMRDVFQQDREGLPVAREKADRIRFKALDDTVAVLTPDQQRRFTEMKGKRFDYKRAPTLSKLMDPAWSKGNVAKPGNDPTDLTWVTSRSDVWAPGAEEKKMDLIGWADGVIPALRLAQEHKRPIFMFTLDGSLGPGRC